MQSSNTAKPLRIDPITGLLLGTRQVLTPYFDRRPGGVVPELIVVHGISMPPGEYGGPWIDKLFTDGVPADFHPFFATVQGLRVSAHALVRRNGDVVQYVPFGDRAWHAGKSEYAGRSGCNDFSVGIEVEGVDDVPYEGVQYARLAVLIDALLTAYPTLSAERIAGHCDIAPGRKADPGPAFEWARLREELARLGRG